MTVKLSKDADGIKAVSLAKEAPNLRLAQLKLTWVSGGDLDISTLAVKADGKVPSDEWFTFYNAKRSPGDVIVHSGDQRVGGVEMMDVDVLALPQEISKVLIVASIHRGDEMGTTFKNIVSPAIAIIDAESGKEIASYDLKDRYADETAVITAELFRQASGFGFRINGEGNKRGLHGIAFDGNVNIG